jgi:glycosyltransferase involved in cell wall biosynthesis
MRSSGGVAVIRVVHVSPTDLEGGAAKGTYVLHKALQEAGVDSRMLVLRKISDDPSVVTKTGKDHSAYAGLLDRLDRVPLRLYNWKSHNWWTVGWLPFDIKRSIDRLAPDIVQFHWAGRGAVPIGTLSRLIHYPLVWSLRDMWPLTGGCHYSGNCARFASGCGICPQLESRSRFDLSWWQWRRKYRAWRHVPITYVALSNWMAKCAHDSPLTFGNEIAVIPNGIDVERYRPIDKAIARSVWGLPTDRRIIMFGALNSMTDPRKGFSYLTEALRLLAKQGWADRATVVVFGAKNGAPEIGLPVRYIGVLQDDVSLALLYSCADVMVVPSVHENAAKTAIEALACGVPVTAFANTGQFDLVDHRRNGYLAENLSVEDLARGIAWCLERMAVDDELSHAARAKAVSCFDVRQIAYRHIGLYERLLAARRQSVQDTAVVEQANLAVDVVPAAVEGAQMTTNSRNVS